MSNEPCRMSGVELFRYLDRFGRLKSVRSDGTTWVSTIEQPGWERHLILKAEIDVGKWRSDRLRFAQELRAQEPWRFTIQELPDYDRVAAWVVDSVCETVTGDTIEPDGVGRDGAPSWLLALCLI